MQEKSSQLLGFFDELTAFWTQIILYQDLVRTLSDSHEVALFLQLFNGHPWRKDTGKHASVTTPLCTLSYLHALRLQLV